MLPLRSLVLLSLVLLLSPMAAHAQAGGKGAPPGYTEAVNQALAELEANNYPEAREEFRRAHAIFPNARTLRGLGMVEFELRNYAESVRLLEEALASTVKPLEGKLRAETESLLERARRYLGEVVVHLDPASASLTVDGMSADGRRPLRLEVGEHTLEAQAPGRATERRVIRLAGGAHLDVKLTLRSLEPAAAPAAAAATSTQPSSSTGSAPSEVEPAYKKWWVWTLVAVVAAGGATAAALVLTRDKPPASPVEGTNTPPGEVLQTLERF